MRFILAALVVILISAPAPAQSFVVDDAASYDEFNLSENDAYLSCFYKTWNSHKNGTHYRAIVFDRNLNVMDTMGYQLPATSKHLLTTQNDKYFCHIFFTKLNERERIEFIVTDKVGMTIARFEKQLTDFQLLFTRHLKKLSELQFQTIHTQGSDADVLILQPRIISGAGVVRDAGRWIALNLSDGAVRWQQRATFTFIRSKTINGRLVTLQRNAEGLNFLQIYDLRNGEAIATASVSASRDRVISIFEVKDSTVLIAGRDERVSKHSHIFVTGFDLSGHLKFDKIDTADRMPGNKVQILGGALDPQGDLVMVGEYYKTDAKAAIASTTLSIALTFLSGYPHVGVANVKTVVLGIVTVRISPEGMVREFKNITVDRRNSFSKMISDEKEIYLRSNEQLWCYDLSSIFGPHGRFISIAADQEVIILSGDLIGIKTDNQKREIVLEKIPGT